MKYTINYLFFFLIIILPIAVIAQDLSGNTGIKWETGLSWDTIKIKAKKKGILLGEGYGEWKPSSFRIANFPALENSEIQILMRFLKSFNT